MHVEELAYHKTVLGELTLRRRTEPRAHNEQFLEVRLGDEYLMSSLLTESEKQLAHLGLRGLRGELDVVVGGLGLGYTAVAALENRMVRTVLVIELFPEVVSWHQDALVPNGSVSTGDARCELLEGDSFEPARSGLDVSDCESRLDAVLLDIDHSPQAFP